ncbi:MAG: NADH-quinone oxidoreductase subunit H [Candidatus Omnitrophica bacterium]|nr:NADH-quinone oxidoreductase subunit H [Candidatus Omnitrophota bacterium]MDD5352104.1 NADH-quinone oxidoreductase subunit H [Candidatus Omnitrophota bacterium]MDD5549702.1 NADH-quinone oxidoreductase subunit H [Candidatus Omnitrophota bacterium]
MIKALFSILIFPGFLFVSVFGLFAEFFDRKIYARLQNRVGPPWFQTFADFIKLLAKEDIVPCEANPRMFGLAPIFALASVITVFLYIPLWKTETLFSFNGDIIMVLYLLTVPTLAFFIGGWYSTSLFARIGSVRCVTQLFAYEVPLFMSILAAALLANSWSLVDIVIFYTRHPLYCLFNLIGFGISLIALLGKLEKTPFDIPEAETEIVAGAFTEYSGRLLAILRLTIDIEMVVGSALLVAVFFPFGLTLAPITGFVVFMAEIMFVIALLSLLRTVVARLRIDQMINFCWKYMVPLAIFQLLLNLTLKRILM